jgi:ABC-2 type transport system ATP-binding protein
MSTSPTRAPLAIRLRALRKRFGKKLALAGVTLELDGAQIVGVVGPDGAGKTTLLRTLAGLLEIEADEATVLGHDLRGDVTELKALIGYVPQVFSLHRDLSVIENLRFTARLHRLPSDEFHRRADDLLARTALDPFRDRAAGALSGGMKQKLAIANALLADPVLLILDEPTAGVDVVARAEIRELLEASRTGAIVLLSTSYLDEAGACDRLVYLDDGRVVATGTPAELRAHAAIDVFRLWGEQPRSVARAARALPWVDDAHDAGRFARVSVRRPDAPERSTLTAQLAGLAGVALVEPIAVDMEATLLALARRAGG